MAASPLEQALDCLRSGQPARAEALCRARILEGKGEGDFAAHHVLGLALLHQGRAGEAEPELARAVALQPGNPAALNSLGMALAELNRAREAHAALSRAAALAPGSAWIRNNLGSVLHDLGQGQDAVRALDEALRLQPDYPEAHANRGMALQELSRFDEARAAFDAAIALRPGYPEALKRRAMLRLLLDDAGGWDDYEAAMRGFRDEHGDGDAAVPWWRGEPLHGRSLLLHEGSGFGDTLQFFRFVPALLARGARVCFCGPPSLFALLRSSGWNVSFIAPGTPSGCDFQCDLWGLPARLGLPARAAAAQVPYLAADAAAIARWKAWLGAGSFAIGVAWQGNPARKIDLGRSIPLSAFAPLAAVPGVQLVSLQCNAGREQLQQLPPGVRMRDPGPGFDAGPNAFADTAALMMALDLVVSSDTAVAHLAGALGRPAWVALKHVPDWRWGLERGTTPWYPAMRLFRQPRPGDWSSVFAAMASRLATGQ